MLTEKHCKAEFWFSDSQSSRWIQTQGTGYLWSSEGLGPSHENSGPEKQGHMQTSSYWGF